MFITLLTIYRDFAGNNYDVPNGTLVEFTSEPIKRTIFIIKVDGQWNLIKKYKEGAIPVTQLIDPVSQEFVYAAEQINDIASICCQRVSASQKFKRCFQFQAFDQVGFIEDNLDSGDFKEFKIIANGDEVLNLQHDYLATWDETNLATLYTPLVNFINSSVDGWRVITIKNGDRPIWRMEYEGLEESSLEIIDVSADNKVKIVASPTIENTSIKHYRDGGFDIAEISGIYAPLIINCPSQIVISE